MNCQNLILNAVDVALAWNLPEEALPGAVSAQLASTQYRD